MIPFILKRLGSGLVVLLAVSILTFFLLYVSSGSIARNILGDQATPEQLAMKEAELGLDQPLVARYFSWLTDALSGNLGASWFTSEPVANALATRIPVTMTMVVAAMILIAIYRHPHWRGRSRQAGLGGPDGPGWRHHRRLHSGVRHRHHPGHHPGHPDGPVPRHQHHFPGRPAPTRGCYP